MLTMKRKYILCLYHKRYTCFCLNVSFYGLRGDQIFAKKDSEYHTDSLQAISVILPTNLFT